MNLNSEVTRLINLMLAYIHEFVFCTLGYDSVRDTGILEEICSICHHLADLSSIKYTTINFLYKYLLSHPLIHILLFEGCRKEKFRLMISSCFFVLIYMFAIRQSLHFQIMINRNVSKLWNVYIIEYTIQFSRNIDIKYILKQNVTLWQLSNG